MLFWFLLFLISLIETELTNVIEHMGGFALVALEGFIGGHKDRAAAQRKRWVGNLIALQQAVELQR